MRSYKPKKIEITQENGKSWASIEFEIEDKNGNLININWMPSFVDIGDIVSKIGYCEDKKYPYGKGYKYFLEFLLKCFNKTRDEIKELYKNEFDPNKKYMKEKT